MEDISEELLIFHCSPTMAGVKTGNLFNCPVNGVWLSVHECGTDVRIMVILYKIMS
ncbi:hypothetical protein AALB47_13005 [Lachnospiraceae bacterium 54-11]